MSDLASYPEPEPADDVPPDQAEVRQPADEPRDHDATTDERPRP